MIDFPWQRVQDPQPGREYFVLLTYLPVRRFRTVLRMALYARRIERQLATAPGLIGYRFRAQPWRRRFWTLSAWDDVTATMDFAYGGFHKGIMLVLRDDMGPTRFTRWRALGTGVPPTWPEALARQG